jgi:D-glycero-D-manno-heptose 1,7-bisphosphate phosphatase
VQGIHTRLRRAGNPNVPARPAVFLDRDGVIVEEVGYLHQLKDVRFIPGALAAIARLNAAGVPVVEVTNQAGIGRGYYTWQHYEIVQDTIDLALAGAGGWLDGAWACGYHPEGIGELGGDHPWRKPNPGMLLDAARRLALDLSASWLIGDKVIDIEAAVRAGLRGAVLVMTGYGAEMRPEVERRAREEWAAAPFQIRYATDLSEAAVMLLSKGG